jgi:hypothetical protein
MSTVYTEIRFFRSESVFEHRKIREFHDGRINLYSIIPFTGWGLFFGIILSFLDVPNFSFAEGDFSCSPKPPYEASRYVEPAKNPKSLSLNLTDNGDGTIVDVDSRLLWTKKIATPILGNASHGRSLWIMWRSLMLEDFQIGECLRSGNWLRFMI